MAFCLDTAHAWGAGYEISRPEEVDRLLAALDGALGPGRIAMVHLNDSKAALGSHVDRHEHIGAGAIGAAGLRAVLLHPSLVTVPFYLETPGHGRGLRRGEHGAGPDDPRGAIRSPSFRLPRARTRGSALAAPAPR